MVCIKLFHGLGQITYSFQVPTRSTHGFLLKHRHICLYNHIATDLLSCLNLFAVICMVFIMGFFILQGSFLVHAIPFYHVPWELRMWFFIFCIENNTENVATLLKVLFCSLSMTNTWRCSWKCHMNKILGLLLGQHHKKFCSVSTC